MTLSHDDTWAKKQKIVRLAPPFTDCINDRKTLPHNRIPTAETSRLLNQTERQGLIASIVYRLTKLRSPNRSDTFCIHSEVFTHPLSTSTDHSSSEKAIDELQRCAVITYFDICLTFARTLRGFDVARFACCIILHLS